MTTMNMTCVCTTEVTSIVLIPSSSKVVFAMTTTTVLENGVELSPTTESVTVALTAELLASVMALKP